MGYSPQGCKDSDTTERLTHTHTHTHTHRVSWKIPVLPIISDRLYCLYLHPLMVPVCFNICANLL